MSVKMRLIILSIIPIVLLIISAVLSMYKLKTIGEGVDSIYKDRVVPLKQIKVVSDNYAVNIVDLLHKYRAGVIDKSQVISLIEQAKVTAQQNWQDYLKTKLTTEEQRLTKDVDEYLAPVAKKIDAYIRDIEDGTFKAMDQSQFVADLYNVFDPLSGSYAALIDLQLTEAQRFRDSAQEQTSFFTGLLLVFIILTIAFMALLAWFIYRSTHGPLSHLQGTIQTIAEQADLTLRAKVTGKDEISTTAEHFNHMLSRIHTLVTDVTGATLTLSSASEQMQAISAQVASTATQQEQQSAMIATAITQMSAAIQEVAQNAQNTSQHAASADGLAEQGSQTIDDNLEAIRTLSRIVAQNAQLIGELNAQSNEINQVVLMIQGVAEQTNLLALNAAIEAARAGDSGRGFAVVADEVRTLAHNTQQATENINTMIAKLQDMAGQAVAAMQSADDSVKESEHHSQESATAINRIREAVADIADMNLQVSTATEEQTTVAAEISQNINEFNDSITSVSQSSQQNADASKELAQLADSLQQQVKAFVV
ncbi:methyl-accepting chemotaxis protein [Pseudoalteromonas ruthenica]|nr:methyl-accepting chemotaxis protein [Pseudoalteromonas ruthenica]